MGNLGQRFENRLRLPPPFVSIVSSDPHPDQEDPAKVAMAARLRAETTMTVDWIAERLGMGSRGYLNHLLNRQRKSGRK